MRRSVITARGALRCGSAAIAAICLLLALLVSTLPAYGATPPEPTYGSATVDGDYSEWDLNNDHFAHMYRAGNPLKPIESHLYVRYDCQTETLYVLVLAEQGVPVLPQADDAFVKLGNATKLVDGNSGNDGVPPDFSWIVEGENGTYVGFEASAPLPPGSYPNLNVHVQVFDDDESQTSAVADRAIQLDILCATQELPDICIEKTALDDNVDPPATLHYTYQVCNPGQVPLSNIVVTDDTCDSVQYVSGDDSPANGLLDPGELWLYTCEYEYAGPADPGTCVVNTVTVTGGYDEQTVDDEHAAVVHCAAPLQGGIQVLKIVDLEHVCPGQELLYRYEVTNLGDNPLSNVTITDDTCSPLSGPAGDDNRNGQLEPRETWVYVCRYRVTGREPEFLENRVRVSGDVLEGGQVVATYTDGHPAIVQIVPCLEPEFVPEPGAALLLVGGLAGMAGYASLKLRRRSLS